MRARTLTSIALLAFVAACSSGDAPAAPEKNACVHEPAGWPSPPLSESVCVAGVRGRAVEPSGAPLAGMLVSVCGVACFSATTSDDGSFRVPIGAHLTTERFSLEVHGRPDHAELYARLPSPLVLEPNIGTVLVPILPPSTVALPDDGAPAATLTAGPLSLSIPGGTTWTLALEDIAAGPPGRALRVAEVPIGDAPLFAKGALRVYALAPASARASAKVAVRLSGVTGVAPGTAIELSVVVADYLTEMNAAGTTEVAASAHVTADGVIESDPGEGITLLTWLVVRVK